MGLEPSSWKFVSIAVFVRCSTEDLWAYLIIILLLVIIVVTVLIIIEVVLILEIILVEVVHTVLELKSLAGEPVDGAGNELLLDVLTELVVKLELLLDVLVNLLVVV